MTKRRKSLQLILISVAILVFLITFGPYLSARISTTLYLNAKHKDKEFSFVSFEFVPQLGDYLVAYKEQNGDLYNFKVGPKYFPIFILFDPLLGGA